MFQRILVVCQGNICRSPLAAVLLRRALPGCEVASAGLGALAEHEMAPLARQVAEAHGLQCPAHRARQLGPELCQAHDLILVMERKQREHILRQFPEASGKAFLLTHWGSGEDIPDPWRKDRDAYEAAYALIDQGVREWKAKLDTKDEKA